MDVFILLIFGGFLLAVGFWLGYTAGAARHDQPEVAVRPRIARSPIIAGPGLLWGAPAEPVADVTWPVTPRHAAYTPPERDVWVAVPADRDATVELVATRLPGWMTRTLEWLRHRADPIPEDPDEEDPQPEPDPEREPEEGATDAWADEIHAMVEEMHTPIWRGPLWDVDAQWREDALFSALLCPRDEIEAAGTPTFDQAWLAFTAGRQLEAAASA